MAYGIYNKNWKSEDDGYDYNDAVKIAELFNKKSEIKITPRNFMNWYDYSSPKFEKAARKLIGSRTYDHFESMARLPYKIFYEIGFVTEKICGGVNLAASFDKRK